MDTYLNSLGSHRGEGAGAARMRERERRRRFLIKGRGPTPHRLSYILDETDQSASAAFISTRFPSSPSLSLPSSYVPLSSSCRLTPPNLPWMLNMFFFVALQGIRRSYTHTHAHTHTNAQPSVWSTFVVAANVFSIRGHGSLSKRRAEERHL